MILNLEQIKELYPRLIMVWEKRIIKNNVKNNHMTYVLTKDIEKVYRFQKPLHGTFIHDLKQYKYKIFMNSGEVYYTYLPTVTKKEYKDLCDYNKKLYQ